MDKRSTLAVMHFSILNAHVHYVDFDIIIIQVPLLRRIIKLAIIFDS
jgi:hypothetical protein